MAVQKLRDIGISPVSFVTLYAATGCDYISSFAGLSKENTPTTRNFS